MRDQTLDGAMILDANLTPLPDRIEVDVCIVGAGPAGIAIARSWLNTPVNVCLVEGGGHDRSLPAKRCMKVRPSATDVSIRSGAG